MATYTIKGWTTGGWDVEDTATSMRRAIAIARETMGGISCDSAAHGRIERDGVPIKAWCGTTSGRWIAVNP